MHVHLHQDYDCNHDHAADDDLHHLHGVVELRGLLCCQSFVCHCKSHRSTKNLTGGQQHPTIPSCSNRYLYQYWLQAVGKDGIYPGIGWFEKGGNANNDPIRGWCFASLIVVNREEEEFKKILKYREETGNMNFLSPVLRRESKNVFLLLQVTSCVLPLRWAL